MILVSTRSSRVVIECEICAGRLTFEGMIPALARARAVRDYGHSFVRRGRIIEAYCIQHLQDMPAADELDHPEVTL